MFVMSTIEDYKPFTIDLWDDCRHSSGFIPTSNHQLSQGSHELQVLRFLPHSLG